MGNLVTLTLYMDDLDGLKQNPKDFAESVYENASRGGRDGEQVHYKGGTYIMQNVVHSSTDAIYISSGNTVCDMSSYSEKTKYRMKRFPEFFKSQLDTMKFHMKNFKEMMKKDKES